MRVDVKAQEKEQAHGKLPRELNKGRDFDRLWLVYFVHCIDGSVCTVIMIQLSFRLENRNTGNASQYAHNDQPVVLVYKDPLAVGNTSKKMNLRSMLFTTGE